MKLRVFSRRDALNFLENANIGRGVVKSHQTADLADRLILLLSKQLFGFLDPDPAELRLESA